MSDATHLKTLGNGDAGFGPRTASYNPALLETFKNLHPTKPYWVRLVCPEFTSLCPKTGQPDFATVLINYIPDVLMVESKALKLYLTSFRNHGEFHEDCINNIANDLDKLMAPVFLEVVGLFRPRGGIAIKPYALRANGEYGISLMYTRMHNFPAVEGEANHD